MVPVFDHQLDDVISAIFVGKTLGNLMIDVSTLHQRYILGYPTSVGVDCIMMKQTGAGYFCAVSKASHDVAYHKLPTVLFRTTNSIV